MQQKKFYSLKKHGIPCIDVSKMSPPNLTQKLTETLEKEHSDRKFSLGEAGNTAEHQTLHCLGNFWKKKYKDARLTARNCANEYWKEISDTIQTAAISGNIRGKYDGIKRTIGPA